MTGGEPQRLMTLTFLEFFGLLERRIVEAERQQRQQREMEQRIKKHR